MRLGWPFGTSPKILLQAFLHDLTPKHRTRLKRLDRLFKYKIRQEKEGSCPQILELAKMFARDKRSSLFVNNISGVRKT